LQKKCYLQMTIFVKKRGEQFRTILSTKPDQIDLLNIIFVELYVINGEIDK
jgi:hypothetical protein